MDLSCTNGALWNQTTAIRFPFAALKGPQWPLHGELEPRIAWDVSNLFNWTRLILVGEERREKVLKRVIKDKIA